MAFYATAAAPTAALDAVTPIVENDVDLLPFAIPPPLDQKFYIAEINYYLPSTGTITFNPEVAGAPVGAFSLDRVVAEEQGTIYTSDVGYISRHLDLPAQTLYAPTLTSGWGLSRIARLEPWGSAGSVSWGTLKISHQDGRYDGIYDFSSTDGRNVKIYSGVKTYDRTRGYHINPTFNSLTRVFTGVGNGLWRKGENEIEIDVRDASYQGEEPLQASIYGGTGGYDGTADIKGRPIPFCRGGTSSNPILNVSPVLIDPTNNIWQYNDAPGTVVRVFERGAEVFLNAGNTTNLYSGSVASGYYRTDNSRGLIQFGDSAQGEITLDVTGAFPSAGAQTTVVNIARYILSETLGIDAQYIDTGSFIGLNAARPWVGGIYITEQTDAMSVVDYLLRSVNAWLIPSRSGLLRATLFQAPGTLNISAAYDSSKIVRCTPRALPALLSPPPYRIQVGHSKRHTIQTDNWAGTATDDRKQLVGDPWSFTTWLSTDNLNIYRKRNDPPPVETALLIASEAQEVVDELGSVFGVRRSLYDIELPSYLVARHELGEEISLSYPGLINDDSPALILGDNFDSNLPTFTLTVLV